MALNLSEILSFVGETRNENRYPRAPMTGVDCFAPTPIKQT